MKPDEVEIATNLTKEVLSRVPDYFKNHKLKDQFLNTDLDYLVFTLKGFTKSFETLDAHLVLPVLTLLQETLSAHLEVSFTFTRAFYEDFYEVLSRLYGWLEYRRGLLGEEGAAVYEEIGRRARESERKFTEGLLIK